MTFENLLFLAVLVFFLLCYRLWKLWHHLPHGVDPISPDVFWNIFFGFCVEIVAVCGFLYTFFIGPILFSTCTYKCFHNENTMSYVRIFPWYKKVGWFLSGNVFFLWLIFDLFSRVESDNWTIWVDDRSIMVKFYRSESIICLPDQNWTIL